MQQYRRKDRGSAGLVSATGVMKTTQNRFANEYRMQPPRRLIQRLRIGFFSACLLSLIACGGTESDFESIESPDGKHILIVTVTVPSLPHALHRVNTYIETRDSGIRQKLLESPLANDGVPFTAKNIGVRWTSATTALVCLRPTDLADHGIRIDVSGTPSAELKPGC
jgi:hypothetical protein